MKVSMEWFKKIIKENFDRTASFDVDAQKGFTILTGELPISDGENIVEALNEQAMLAKYRVGSKDAHPMNALYFTNDPDKIMTPIVPTELKNQPGGGYPLNMDVYWPTHCVPGTDGFDLLDWLPHPMHYDFFVYKGLEIDVHPYGACYHDLAEKRSTGVIEFLRSKNVNVVIVGGLATDYCVETTAMQLMKAGFTVYVNLKASRGVDIVTTESAINQMTRCSIYVVED